MNIRPNRITYAIGAIMTCSLLAACGGGGSGGMVRIAPPPTPPAPSAPPLATTEPCPMPVNGDCIVQGQHTLTFDEFGLSGGRQSDHKLFVHGGDVGGGTVNLKQGEFRFSGGTEIAGTTLVVWDTLVSDVHILRDYTGLGFIGESELWLLGTVRGNVRNEQRLNLRCWSGLHACSSIPQQRIDGNYIQLPDGIIEIVPGRHLQVTGTASLDGGLVLSKGDAAYVLPAAPSSILLLHADAGVAGTFAHWNSAGLFLQGSLRYTTNEVFFDATRLSLQAAIAGQGFGGITVVSAGNLDRALGIADGFGARPVPLTAAQSRFLQSAGRLLWLDDAAQAARSLDSLAGSEHAWLATDTQKRSSEAAGRLALHAGTRRMDGLSSHWSLPLADGHIGGYDQWVGLRTLLGGSIAREASADGTTSRDNYRASLYLHQRGAYWQGTLVATAGRSNGLLQRRIDLADGRAHVAGARRRLDLVQLHAELARPFTLAGGNLQPYAALDAGVLHGGSFLEQGDTGFELTSDGGVLRQVGAALGLRYAREWRIGMQRFRLLAELQRAQRVHMGGQWQAAFIGVPDASFGLRDWSDPRASSAQLSLQGDTSRGWQWAISSMRDGRRTAPQSWWLRLARDF